MNRQKMITVAADDIVVLKVGSVAEFQHKRQMAGVTESDLEYQAEVQQEARRPQTLRKVLGIAEGLTMRTAFA